MNVALADIREQTKQVAIKKGNQTEEIKGLTKEQVIIFLPNILITMVIET
jgi:hypothetical protein